MRAFEFKIADRDDEFEAIHALNYRTFVEEIPQHAPNPQRRLVDAFHGQNIYAICKIDGNLIGMVAGRAQRPFSLDSKLDDLDDYLPPHRKPVEIRLLAIEQAYRKSSVFVRLMTLLAAHFAEQGHDLALISGTLRQSRLYRHMGFTAFGPEVGTDKARYQPMYLDIRRFTELQQVFHRVQLKKAAVVNLLPGPVAVRPEVAEALRMDPISHRSETFLKIQKRLTCQLQALTQSKQVYLMPGSGTSANDAIAARLSTLPGRGLVLSNGEFGDRLIDHAHRWRLDHVAYRQEWGESLDIPRIANLLEKTADAAWIWMVACETSTGINNPWQELASYCHGRAIDFCLDAISAIGAEPVNLENVRFATCVSGKALGAYPGIAIVFYNGPPIRTSSGLPRALDLAQYEHTDGIPYTLSSNLVSALSAALDHTNWKEKHARIKRVSSGLRRALETHGIDVLARGADASAAVITIRLPQTVDSVKLCQRLQHLGYLLSGESNYLAERNWIQVCLFGEFDANRLNNLPKVISREILHSESQQQ